ncbi:meiotic nuclear division protein 1 homolog isoform X1 [Strongylocentrotus purpuratus]|uniref:Meiotic nuclear division protein 1 homolog n=1 Tax=Strongylocentrotus purpuratus TaxID=7668 RepID=A0A7M7RDR3_STRPU|nr:meiotic nuclear division protein 1 homolog isoform X1 [Strongylocentrotus purpuratus]|eukprot:XP_791291.2 PREDICTED: meiotic nuclear division protein 1 homolog [Strongylocentrotus purpuratus]
MSRKRGLSLDEKRQRMQEIFFEKKGVFQLKEIEKIAPKEKGITPMAVKDVLQSLVDDGLVDSDRIGTSNYYWAFPSKASQVRKRKIQDLTKALDESEKKRIALEKTAAKSTVGKEESDERGELLKVLSEKETDNGRLDAELERFRECDPEVIEEVKAEAAVAKEATNRWTDNVFSIKSWCKKKFSLEEKLLDKQFGIPEDFDYLD